MSVLAHWRNSASFRPRPQMPGAWLHGMPWSSLRQLRPFFCPGGMCWGMNCSIEMFTMTERVLYVHAWVFMYLPCGP